MKNEPIGKHLSIAFRKYRNVLNASLREANIVLGSGQFPLLIALYKKDGINQHSLCRMFDLDKGAVARGIGKLVRNDLVTKTTDPRDNRKSLLLLTPKAQKLRETFYSVLEEVDLRMKENLSEEEVDIFFQIINKIEGSLQAESIAEAIERSPSRQVISYETE